MLHTKFQGHRSTDTGEDLFLFYFFTTYGHVGHVTMTIELLSVPRALKATYEIWLQLDGSVVSEKTFEIVNRRRTTEPAHTIGRPGAFRSGGLKVGSCPNNCNSV